jgi:LPXTG-motif cell wall-anchored protein
LPAPNPETGPSTDMYIIAAAVVIIVVVAALALKKRM